MRQVKRTPGKHAHDGEAAVSSTPETKASAGCNNVNIGKKAVNARAAQWGQSTQTVLSIPLPFIEVAKGALSKIRSIAKPRTTLHPGSR
jgi:hypothetical protein